MKKMIRKLAALMLALVMVLGCAAASATSVDVAVKVDGEAVKGLLGGFGMPEEMQAPVDTIAGLLSALDVKVVTEPDGGEITLGLAGTEALKAGFASTEDGLAFVSTLIPNYILTIRRETVQQMLQEVLAKIPGLGAIMGAANGESAGFAVPESLSAYVQKIMMAVMGGMVTGTPEQGEFVFEGLTFDTKAPMSMDMPKVTESLKTTLDEMFQDESILEMFHTFTGMLGDSAPSVEDIKKGVAEFLDHMPETVTVDYYSSTAMPGAFYMTGEAAYAQQEGPAFTYAVLSANGDVKIDFNIAENNIAITLAIVPNRLTLKFQAGEAFYVILDGSVVMEDTQVFTVNLCVNSESPMVTVTVGIGQDGARTLPVEKGEKTEVPIEDLMNGGSLPEGFMNDVLTNAAPLLANPDIAKLLALFTPVTTVTVETPVSVEGE